MDQEKYGNALHEASVIGATAIKDNRWNFDQLLKFLSSQRKQTADMLNQKQSKNIYGLLRTGPYKTPCENIYKQLGNDLLSLHVSGEEPFYTKKSDSYYKTGTIKGEIHGKPVELSNIKISTTNALVNVIHSPAENIPICLEYVSELYDHALAVEDKDLLLQELGRIFWWICQAKPWEGGDPSIAEMLIKSIWLAKTGGNLPPWEKDLIPWVAVMKQFNVEQFAQDFHSLFSV